MDKFFKKSNDNNENIEVNKAEVDEAELAQILADKSTVSIGSGRSYKYVVLQVTLKEKFIGTGSKNLSELEAVINNQAKKGYRLHTISTAVGSSAGLGGGDRIQATMVFESVE